MLPTVQIAGTSATAPYGYSNRGRVPSSGRSPPSTICARRRPVQRPSASRRLDFKKTAPMTHSGGDGPHRRGSGGCSPNRTPPGSADTWSSSVVPRASSVTVVSTASASRSRIGSRRSPHPIGFPPGRVTRAGIGVMLKGCGAQRRPGRARSAEPRDLPARGGGRAVRRPAARQRRGVPRLWRLRSVSGGPVLGPPSAR